MIQPRLRTSIDALMDWMARQGAKRYIAGQTIDQALAACDLSRPATNRFIICPWDRPGDSPQSVFRSYSQAIESLHENRIDCYLSVKLPSLAFDHGRLDALVEMGSAHGVRIHLDALTPDSVEPTIRILRTLRARYSNLGYTVPGRWRRSLSDLPHLLDLALPLRVVKGQLPDRLGGEMPLHEGFLGIIERLTSSVGPVGIATHERLLASRSLTTLTQAGVRCEVEQLYRLKRVPDDLFPNVPRRLYVPYGHGYPPYDVYAALRRPRLALRLTADVLCGICIRPSPSAATTV